MNTASWRPLLRRTFLPSLTGSLRRILAVTVASVALLTQKTAHAYTHPCMPLTAADIATLNASKNTGQWATGYAAFSTHWRAQLGYVQQGPFVEVGRNSNVNLNQWRNDMVAIWALSMQWKFTGDSAYAEKAKAILLSWATTHTTWTGIEPYLEMGDYMKFFGTGASILRSYSGWTTANTTTVKNYMANVHYPAAGVEGALRSANQGGAHLEGSMGVAVYNDDTALFNKVVAAYRTNSCTGLRTTLSNGQIGDTGRDVGHARVELLHYAWISEVALKAAGVDLFTESNNRLLAAGEYFSNYNSGGNPAFIKSGTCYFIFRMISGDAPGNRAATIGPDFLHILHSAYVVRKGLSMPYLTSYRANQTDDMFTWVFRKASDNTTGTSLPPVVTATPVATNNVSNLTRLDIGTFSPASTVSFSGGTWSVTSAGLDQWGPINSNEKFTFVHAPVVGDAMMIARVANLGAASSPVAGLMFRESLALGARMAMIECFKGTAETTSGVDGLGISTRGAASNSHYKDTYFHPTANVPYWLKVERLGNQITLFSSADGTNWSPSHTSWYTGLASTGYIGLCVASRATGVSTTATFTNVSVSGLGGGGFPAAGTYNLAAKTNGMRLDSFGRTANGSNCAIYADSGNNNQNWILSYVSSNVVKLQAAGGGLYLDGMGRTANGSFCGLYASSSNNNQRWTIIDAGGGYFKLKNVGTGKCLDIGASPWANGDNVEQYGEGGSGNQQWQFVP